MTPNEKLNPEDEAIIKTLESAAEGIKPSPLFEYELEKRLMSAHKPKRTVFISLRENILPTLGWTVALVILIFVLNWAARSLSSSSPAHDGGFICPVTKPNGSLPPGETVASPEYLGNGELWTSLWPDGKIIMEATDREADGSFSMKWGWVRAVSGPLKIEGHRLDGEAPTLRAHIPSGYGDTGFQVSGLIFPTTGCWEVTGRVGKSSLTFVTEVLFGGATPTPNVTLAVPLPTPTGDAYNWNGTTVYLNAPLPEQPVQASVFIAKPEQPATLERVRALASQFGLQGQIYVTDGEIVGTTDLAVVDGRQRLYVRSDRYFTYYADYTASTYGKTTLDNPNAEALINDFMKSHGLDFAYRIEQSELYDAYLVVPLAADGLAVHLDYFKANGLMFRLNEAGIVQVEASLMKYGQVGTYGIRTAQQALDQLLDPNTASIGVISNMHSFSPPPETWERIRPQDTIVTIYGWMKSIKSAEGGPALVTLDSYTVTGKVTGIAEEFPNTFVEATGKLHTENNTDTFELESWKVYDGNEDGLQGTLQRRGDQVVLTTLENETYTLPDVPATLSLPKGPVFVIGVKRGDVFEWKSFDLRAGQGGGGGGGGGTGIHKLNLTGTPMPLPTPEAVTLPQVGSGQYIVKEGDTLSAIAQTTGVSIEKLMQLNGLADPGRIFVGQLLIIPTDSNKPIENLRGILTITTYNQADGGQRVEYGFVSSAPAYPYMILEGENLQSLQNYHNRPINIWGKIDHINDAGITIVRLDKFEIPFPDLKFQILKGTEKSVNIQGKTALLFISEDGTSYIQLAPNCNDVIGPESVTGTGKVDEPLLLEALVIPDLTFGDYPAICVYSTATALNPKNGQPNQLTVTADQPYVVDESTSQGEVPTPTAAIENVELVYYVADPRSTVTDLAADQPYIQPMWRFTGHYSTGDEFEILVQALKDEFLSPQIQTIQGPG